MTVNLSSNKLALRVNDLLIQSSELDKIQPSYEATLMICSQDELFSVAIPCQVIPGSLHHVTSQPTNFEKQLLPGRVIKELVLEMFDAYGNHVKDVDIQLNVDGFRFQDKSDPYRKVDAHGCVDLSGILKVTKGYGKNVSFSVSSGRKLVFKEEFQTEKRVLRVASGVPKICVAGSQLENIVFEIINSEGDVDESIHDEETRGDSHTLVIKSNSMDTDDSVRYSFRHGRCIVRAIPLPQKDGIFCFVAAHSRHPELYLNIEVPVKQAPKPQHGSIQSQCLAGNTLLLQDSSAFKVPKVEYEHDDDVLRQCPEGKILLLQDSSAPKEVGNLVDSIMNDQKELGEDVIKYGMRIGQHEEKLQILESQQVAIERDISNLQASINLGFCNDLGYLPEKEVMMERIECKGGSAAAVVCQLLREISSHEKHNDFVENVVGVVALLGTVQTNELSRILAEYLGEDQMLAVLCKSYATAGDLEKYEQSGNVDHAHALHALATELGKSINGRYLVICLEDIRPFTGEFCNDPQRKLVLPDPTLPNGKTPPGYLGYAVNMIYLDVHHIHTKTAAGHGLRETLFYFIFGELQVYETRDYMKRAHSYIKQGAVSLDGGILKERGVISLGRGEPDIHFPVVTPGSQMDFSSHSMEILKQIEAKKLKLREITHEIASETKTYHKVMKKFSRKRDRYRKFLDEKGPLLTHFGSPC